MSRLSMLIRKAFAGGLVIGQQEYTTPGTYSWTCPAGVTSISVVCVGGGGGGDDSTDEYAGGGGGGLRYANNYAVTPGDSYTVVVGAAGVSSVTPTPGGASYFGSTSVCRALGGDAADGIFQGGGGSGNNTGSGGGGTGGNGGAGGATYGAGGGGAGGYAGNGTNGVASSSSGTSDAATGGAASGGFGHRGGGVGIYGQGASGAASTGAGKGGSGGQNGDAGGNYGAGGAPFINGVKGAVRIIWPGDLRQFPSTRTANE